MLKIIFFIVAIYAVTCGIFYFFQSYIIFRRASLSGSYTYESAYPIEEIVLGDSIKFHAALVKAEQSKGVIVYFHGNRGNIQRWIGLTEGLMKYGYDILLVEYPSYGKNRAELIQSNLDLLAELSYKYAIDNYGHENTVIYGRSIGTGLAAKLATKSPVKCIVLETPYYSLTDLVARYTFFIPYNYLLKFEFDSYKHLKATKSKVLIVHGTDDFVIPVRMARKLSEVNSDSVRYLEIKGGSHNNLSNFAVYWEALDILLKKDSII
jgi:pimeloyl-ACP methyl ester carboxylesterase